MPISREDVLNLYRFILRRPPESEEAVLWNMTNFASVEDAITAFQSSFEFKSKFDRPPAYYPESSSVFRKNSAHSLAIAAIVKNEEKHISRMLGSCIPIIDYAVIADTGSEDETITIAEGILKDAKIPHRIQSIEFVDFSQARNAALDMVAPQIEWTLMLDADEHLVAEDYQKWLDCLNSKQDLWTIPRYNFRDHAKNLPVHRYPDFQRRLLRNRRIPPLRFEGAVHESIAEPFTTDVADLTTKHLGGPSGGPHIHHVGFINMPEEQRKLKFERYAALELKKR